MRAALVLAGLGAVGLCLVALTSLNSGPLLQQLKISKLEKSMRFSDIQVVTPHGLTPLSSIGGGGIYGGGTNAPVDGGIYGAIGAQPTPAPLSPGMQGLVSWC